MMVEVKRKLDKPPIEKGTKFHVLGVHWDDETHNFDYYVEHNGKTISIDKADTDIA